MRRARQPFICSRRGALLAGLGAASMYGSAAPAAPAAPAQPQARAASSAWAVRPVAASEAIRQLHAGGPSGLLGTGASGNLWALSLTGQPARRLAEGLDAATPLATGHGRIAARLADGSLWVWEAGRARTTPTAKLAAHAGLLVLPLAVIAVVLADKGDPRAPTHHLARFEIDGAGRWLETARTQDAVLPDALPVQVDLDGRLDGGHISVLAGPDATRYGHAVLGDGIEATRVLWLERHGLHVLRAFDLPAPHVFEDTAPRPVQLAAQSGQPGHFGLLTVRSGPEGGQLALVTADPARPHALQIAALGDTVGGFHRWLAPTTDGQQLVAVHTPHIGGVLHVYQSDAQPKGKQLTRRRLLADVSTHRIGSRELDLAVWLRGLLILPSQDGLRLRVLNPAADWTEQMGATLLARIGMTVAVPDPAQVAVLTDDGRVWVVVPPDAVPIGG